ncbi:hypothetical protein GIB67_025566, partial [Kingdonia uniflora]
NNKDKAQAQPQPPNKHTYFQETPILSSSSISPIIYFPRMTKPMKKFEQVKRIEHEEVWSVAKGNTNSSSQQKKVEITRGNTFVALVGDISEQMEDNTNEGDGLSHCENVKSKAYITKHGELS